MESIPYVSSSVVEDLQNSIDLNLDRYASLGFTDLARDARWNALLNCNYDPALLAKLNHDPASTDSGRAESDRENTVYVGRALAKLTPEQACREEIWVRLSHFECFEYARNRWLAGKTGDKLAAQIRIHMFAAGRTGRRDDHAISRLWWNYHFAQKLRPGDPESVLDTLVKSADIRSSLVERPWTAMRPDIALGIICTLEEMPELSAQAPFREFMKLVNLAGGGKVFEIMGASAIRKELDICARQALD